MPFNVHSDDLQYYVYDCLLIRLLTVLYPNSIYLIPISNNYNSILLIVNP